MDDYTHAHRVFRRDVEPPYSNPEFVREIDTYRKSFNGVLFIDRVLKAIGITKSKAKAHPYPPKGGEKGLYDLHRQICESIASVHHKLSVFYYILLDFDSVAGRTNLAEHYAFQFAVPEKYRLFMKGLWLLDRQQFSTAVEYLSHPSLTPEFADDIVTVLVRQAENNDYTLALAYYHTVRPVLNTSSALSLLFEAMAMTSLTEAFYFSRTKPEQTRQLLFQQLIASVLGGSGTPDTAARATELVSLPLDGAEEQWFGEFLTTGEGRKLRNAKDTVLMRRVVTGRHAESINDKNLGGQWAAVLGGFKSGMGGRTA